VVVGGGVAGLEAARVAALRGHRVTLLERQSELGGQVRLARRAPGRGEIGTVADQLCREAEQAGVVVRTGVDADAASVMVLVPDAVIVATGSDPRLPSLEGGNGRLVSARDVLVGAPASDKVVVFDTKGDLVGATTADFLADRGRQVTLVTSQRSAGARVEPMTWRLLYQRLIDRRVDFLVEHRIARMTDQGLAVCHVITGKETLLVGVGLVVAADGASANDGLYRRLRQLHPDLVIRLVGDAAAPRQIEQAVYDGHMAARAI